MKIEITLGNNSYRITAPDAINVIVERKVIVDPTKSPAFDPEKHSAEIRQKWREPKYFSTVEKALASLVDRAVRAGKAETFAELLGEITQYKRQISVLMSVE